MITAELKTLLDGVADTRELILRPDPTPDPDIVLTVWRDARAEAVLAYRAWGQDGGGEAYAAYRAAQDREDAAQDLLASAAGRP